MELRCHFFFFSFLPCSFTYSQTPHSFELGCEEGSWGLCNCFYSLSLGNSLFNTFVYFTLFTNVWNTWLIQDEGKIVKLKMCRHFESDGVSHGSCESWEADTENARFRDYIMLMKCRIRFNTSKYSFAIALEGDWISNLPSPTPIVEKLKYYSWFFSLQCCFGNFIISTIYLNMNYYITLLNSA